MLNTSLAEKKQEIIVETTEGTAGKEDDIEYNLGFLGLVPATEDEEEGWGIGFKFMKISFSILHLETKDWWMMWVLTSSISSF